MYWFITFGLSVVAVVASTIDQTMVLEGEECDDGVRVAEKVIPIRHHHTRVLLTHAFGVEELWRK